MRERLEERVHASQRVHGSIFGTALLVRADVWSLGQLEKNEAQIADKGAGVCLHITHHFTADRSCILCFYEEACLAVKIIDLMDTLEYRDNLPPSNVFFFKRASTPVL